MKRFKQIMHDSLNNNIYSFHCICGCGVKKHLTAAIGPSSPCATVSYPWQAVLAPAVSFLI